MKASGSLMHQIKTVQEVFTEGYATFTQELLTISTQGYACCDDDVFDALSAFLNGLLDVAAKGEKDDLSLPIITMIGDISAGKMSKYLYTPKEYPMFFSKIGVTQSVPLNFAAIPVMFEIPLSPAVGVRFFPTADCKRMLMLAVLYDDSGDGINTCGAGPCAYVHGASGSVIPLDVWKLPGATAFIRTSLGVYMGITTESYDEEGEPTTITTHEAFALSQPSLAFH